MSPCRPPVLILTAYLVLVGVGLYYGALVVLSVLVTVWMGLGGS